MKKIVKHFKKNWYKYGFEILVVVIGVLIAFSLNNWNQNRINLKHKNIILFEIKSNLEENLTIFNKNIRTEEETLRRIDTILKYIDNRLPYIDSLGYHFQKVKHLESVAISASAYESLKSTEFDLLSQELKMDIIKLYEVIYSSGVQIIEEGAIGAQQARYPIFLKYFRFIKHSGGSLYDGTTTGISVPNDYEEILKNKEIVNMISDRIGWKNAVIVINMNFIDETKIMIKKVNEAIRGF